MPTRMTIQEIIDHPDRQELAKLLKTYSCQFSWDDQNNLWNLSGTDESGNYWETDKYEASGLVSAWQDATNYLIDHN